ncbi:MAG: endonuclease V, partial [Nitrospinota bacterium]|nr:endonuclease V [Nitrospinota bacterium]
MMKSSLLHSWNVSPEEAVRIQCDLRSKVIRKNDFGCLKIIAGVDIAFCATSNRAFAGIVVLSFPEMEILEKRVITGTITFPYIPGLLAFREGPLIIKL